jgi:hypothetical protein
MRDYNVINRTWARTTKESIYRNFLDALDAYRDFSKRQSGTYRSFHVLPSGTILTNSERIVCPIDHMPDGVCSRLLGASACGLFAGLSKTK